MHTNENGLTLEQGQPVKTLLIRTHILGAIRGLIQRAATGFYLDRGITPDTILMTVLALIYCGWRAAQ